MLRGKWAKNVDDFVAESEIENGCRWRAGLRILCSHTSLKNWGGCFCSNIKQLMVGRPLETRVFITFEL